MNEILKDRYGKKIGEIQDLGSRKILKDARGQKLGEFDGRITKDARGVKIGEGNLLVSLLKY